MRRVWIIFCSLVLILSYSAEAQFRHRATPIEVPQGQSRTFMLTNKLGLYFCGETNAQNSARYQGLSYLTREYLEDLLLEVGGKPLERRDARATLFADSLKRFYQSLKLTETIHLPDSLPALIIRLESPQRYLVKIVPMASGSRRLADFNIHWDSDEKILFISNRKQLVRNSDEREMSITGIFVYPLADYFSAEFSMFSSKNSGQNFDSVAAGELHTMLDGKCLILAILGNSKKEITELRNKILNLWHIKFEPPKTKIEGIRKI